MKLPRLSFLKSIYPDHAPFHVQSCIYRAVTAMSCHDAKFRDLEFVDDLSAPVVFDYRGPDVTLPNPGCAGNVYEGHIDYWYHNSEKSIIVTGHEHVCQAKDHVTLGFDYWDWVIYKQFSDPMLYDQINRAGISKTDLDVLLLVGSMRDHRRTILQHLDQASLGHNWVTDAAHGMLHRAHNTSELGMEQYFNKLGISRFQQYTQYAHWANTDDSCSLDHLPHRDMYARCRLNLVLETTAKNTISPFLTEKTWKVLAQARPFVIFGDTHSLDKLKQQGFRTFEDFCDESYDRETDLEKRSLKCIESVQQLLSAMQHHSDEIDDICYHNQCWFFSPRRHYQNHVKFGRLCLEHIYA